MNKAPGTVRVGFRSMAMPVFLVPMVDMARDARKNINATILSEFVQLENRDFEIPLLLLLYGIYKVKQHPKQP